MNYMVCGDCGKYGIRWEGPVSAPERMYTKCPHCGGVNCQETELPPDDDNEAQITQETASE